MKKTPIAAAAAAASNGAPAKPEPRVSLPVGVVQHVCNYLAERPFKESAPLLQLIEQNAVEQP